MSTYDRTVSALAIEEVIDLERYPIDQLDAAGNELVEQCRRELAASGVSSLAGFVKPSSVAQTIAVGDALADKAWHANQAHNVYFTDLAGDERAAQHPLRRELRSSQRAIAYDLLPVEAPVRVLYGSDLLIGFLEAVLGVQPLYRSTDPLDAVQISHFRPGDELGWHFDNSEFSVTLMLREPDDGGHFEWHPALRSDSDEQFDRVQAALDDEMDPRRLPTAPGTLAIFQGRHALHRVTPVVGTTTRMNAVFTFGAEPDMRLTPSTQRLFYGRNVPNQ